MSTPRDQALAAVRAAFCAVLCVPEVADDANLFTLGGDSLALVEVAIDVDDALDVEIPDAELRRMAEAERCTVAELAAVVEQAMGDRR